MLAVVKSRARLATSITTRAARSWYQCSTVDELLEALRTQQKEEGRTLKVLYSQMLHQLLGYGKHMLGRGIEESELDSLSTVDKMI